MASKNYACATLEEDKVLVEEGRKFAAIYDKKLKDYKDRNVNVNCWVKVAMSCGILDDEGACLLSCFLH